MPLDGLLLKQLLILPSASTIIILHMQVQNGERARMARPERRFIVVFDSLAQVQLFYDTGLKAPLTALHACSMQRTTSNRRGISIR